MKKFKVVFLIQRTYTVEIKAETKELAGDAAEVMPVEDIETFGAGTVQESVDIMRISEVR